MKPIIILLKYIHRTITNFESELEDENDSFFNDDQQHESINADDLIEYAPDTSDENETQTISDAEIDIPDAENKNISDTEYGSASKYNANNQQETVNAPKNTNPNKKFKPAPKFLSQREKQAYENIVNNSSDDEITETPSECVGAGNRNRSDLDAEWNTMYSFASSSQPEKPGKSNRSTRKVTNKGKKQNEMVEDDNSSDKMLKEALELAKCYFSQPKENTSEENGIDENFCKTILSYFKMTPDDMKGEIRKEIMNAFFKKGFY